MSDIFNHELDALESYLTDMEEGFGHVEIEYSDIITSRKIDVPNSKNIIKPEKKEIIHFGKNLIEDMSIKHLENSIKFVISKNTILDDYQKELLKVMTKRLGELKTTKPITSFTIIDNDSGEIILEC